VNERPPACPDCGLDLDCELDVALVRLRRCIEGECLHGGRELCERVVDAGRGYLELVHGPDVVAAAWTRLLGGGKP